MKVYVVMYDLTREEDKEVMAVFSTKEKAKLFAALYTEYCNDKDDSERKGLVTVNEFEVE